MKKISTFFEKDPSDLGLVIDKVNENNTWVLDGLGIPTRKFDGTACAIIDSNLYKRYNAKINKKTKKYKKGIPDGAIPCQRADLITGHHPHWVMCNREESADKWHFAGFDALEEKEDGTYELCGEKVQGNPEKIIGHKLIRHGTSILSINTLTFDGIKNFLIKNDIEGIVFHHKNDNRMCKIRKSDFGIKR